MSLTGFLKFGETFLPITRGELVKDSNGDIALHSPLFEAKAVGDPGFPEGRHGLITGAEKKILQALSSEDSPILNQATLSFQFGTNEVYNYDGKAELEIQLVAGDNITIEDNGSGEITLAANDPTVLMETITNATDVNYPIILAKVNSNTSDRITTYKHLDLNYNPATKTLTVPNIAGTATFAKGIVPGTDGIGTGTNPIYVNNKGEVVASIDTVGSSLENSAIPIYLCDGELTAIASTIGGPTTINNVSGFSLSYMASGMIQSYQGDLGNSGQNPLCVKSGILQQASETIGNQHNGIYMAEGTLTPMKYVLEANVNETAIDEVKPLAVYSDKNNVKKLACNVGATNHPLYVANGVLSPIKISNSSNALYLVGTEGTATSETNGKLYTGTQSSYGVRLIGGNKVYANGGFFESSDETLKDFHSNIPIDLDALSKLPKKYFTWKSDNINTQIGTSAQELQKIYPELVSADSDGILHVAYDKLSVVALAAIDTLYNSLEDMRTENEELKVRLERLERLVYEN